MAKVVLSETCPRKKVSDFDRDHRAILTIIKQKIFYSKVESACLGVSVGKACVWLVYLLIYTSYSYRLMCKMQCIC